MNFDTRECKHRNVEIFTAEAAKHAEFILCFLCTLGCLPSVARRRGEGGCSAVNIDRVIRNERAGGKGNQNNRCGGA
jgi:hypothetical protein